MTRPAPLRRAPPGPDAQATETSPAGSRPRRPRGAPRRQRTEAELAVLRDPTISSVAAGRALGLSKQRVLVLRAQLGHVAARRRVRLDVYAEDRDEIERRAAADQVDAADVVARLLAEKEEP